MPLRSIASHTRAAGVRRTGRTSEGSGKRWETGASRRQGIRRERRVSECGALAPLSVPAVYRRAVRPLHRSQLREACFANGKAVASACRVATGWHWRPAPMQATGVEAGAQEERRRPCVCGATNPGQKVGPQGTPEGGDSEGGAPRSPRNDWRTPSMMRNRTDRAVSATGEAPGVGGDTACPPQHRMSVGVRRTAGWDALCPPYGRRASAGCPAADDGTAGLRPANVRNLRGTPPPCVDLDNSPHAGSKARRAGKGAPLRNEPIPSENHLMEPVPTTVVHSDGGNGEVRRGRRNRCCGGVGRPV